MKIATYNVNGVNGRLAVLLRWLEEDAPDIVCLQELKSPNDRFPRAELERAGYGAVWHGQKSWNGVAILAKGLVPLLTRRGLPGDPDDTHSRYIEAAVDGILIGCLYLPNGNPAGTEKTAYKWAWMDRLRAHAKELLALEEPLVLAGDYNVIPAPEDAKHPEAWTGDALFLPDTRKRFRALVNLGFTDALRACSDAAGLYTFWDYQAGAWQRNNGIRIDHLLLSPQAADRLDSVAIDKEMRSKEKPSDHVPIRAMFRD